VSGWTTIPPWLYRSDLPDERLQEHYVLEAERTLAEVVEDRLVLEREVADLRATKRGRLSAEEWAALADELGERYDWLEEAYRVEARAKAFLDQARAVLEGYRRRRRGP
jgi:hypothetical protein